MHNGAQKAVQVYQSLAPFLQSSVLTIHTFPLLSYITSHEGQGLYEQ